MRKWGCRNADHSICAAVIEKECVIAHDPAAGEDDIWHIANFLVVKNGLKNWIGSSRKDDEAGTIKQRGTETIVRAMGNAMIDEEPAASNLNRRTCDSYFRAIPHTYARSHDLYAARDALLERNVGNEIGADVAIYSVIKHIVAIYLLWQESDVFIVDLVRRDKPRFVPVLKPLREKVINANRTGCAARVVRAVIRGIGEMYSVINDHESRIFAPGVTIWFSALALEVCTRYIHRCLEALVDVNTVAALRISKR